jgi:hypothetical protein
MFIKTTLAAATMLCTVSTMADANCYGRGCGPGTPAIAGAIIGGALLGSILAQPPPPNVVYVPVPVTVPPEPPRYWWCSATGRWWAPNDQSCPVAWALR